MMVQRRSSDFNDIQCEEIRRYAEEYDVKVDEMMRIAVRHFGVDENRQKQILASKNVDISMADCDTYIGDDKKPGCKYIISWYFNLEDESKKPDSHAGESDYELLCCDNIVYFQYTCKHVVLDSGELKAERYFSFYARVKGMEKRDNGGCDKNDNRVGYENENYGHYRLFNPFVATDLALKAKETIERIDLMKQIKDEYGFEYDRIFGYHNWQC